MTILQVHCGKACENCRNLQYIFDLRGIIEEIVLTWAEKASGVTTLGYDPELLPDRMLFHRDGVGESEFDMVERHEKPQMLCFIFDCCISLNVSGGVCSEVE